MLKHVFSLSVALVGCALAEVTVPYPGQNPGKAFLSVGAASAKEARMENGVLQFIVREVLSGQSEVPFPSFSFRHVGEAGVGELPAVETEGVPLYLTLEEGGNRKIVSAFSRVSPSAPEDGAWKEGPGRRVFSWAGENAESGVKVSWYARLDDGGHYVKHCYIIEARKDLELAGFCPFDLKGKGFEVPGAVPGTPLVHPASMTFYGVEQPVAIASVHDEGGASVGFECRLPMKAGSKYVFTAVTGVYPPGQLRRGFLSYLEQERAKPYHQFLHYNGWYDHGLSPTEENMLATVKAYGEELVDKRGIKLDSFVLDDGWDDYRTDLWQPHPQKFPHGFGKLAEAIRGIDSHFGIWISPLGGYSGSPERLAHAKRMGLVPEDAEQLDLSFPEYYNWYLNRCRELMKNDGVNFFKWDRAGGGVSPHFMSLLRIAGELRRENPDLFLSTTVGTWPSPFWLNHVDCIWRTGSSDVNWIGEGNSREQYITYRDASCYRLIVQKAPLFPLNSLMHHGVVLGKEFQGRRTSDARLYAEGKAQEPKEGDGDFMSDTTIHTVDFPVNNDLRKDVRIFMASGANLQELYLSPDMMNQKAWDDVAEAARWAKQYEDVLADVHWVGGNPEKGEVYGYAAWRGGRGATLVLRNPTGKKQGISLNFNDLFQPAGKDPVTELHSPYADQRIRSLAQEPGKTVSRVEEKKGAEWTVAESPALVMEPFEVLVFSVRFDKK